MTFCTKCGKPLEPNEKFCSRCGAAAVQTGNSAAGARQETNAPPPPREDFFQKAQERTQKFVSSQSVCPVKLTEGEEIIKQYEVTRALILPLRGYITVTNKRLLLHSKGLFSNFVQETPVSDVGTIHQSTGFTFRGRMLIAAIAIFVLAGVVNELLSFVSSSGNYTFWMVVFGIVCLILTIKPSNVIAVKTGKATGSGIECGDTLTTGLAFRPLGAFKGKDAEIVMSELGALVMDFQTLGDLAVEKWKK